NKEYYSYIERQKLEERLAESGEQYDKNLAEAVITDRRVKQSIDVTVGSRGKNFLELAGGAGIDLGWIKNVGIESVLNTKGGKLSLNMGVKLNNEALLSTDILMDRDNKELYLCIPEMSSRYLKSDYKTTTNTPGLPAELEDPMALLQSLAGAMPSSEVLKSITLRYFDLVIANIPEMEKKDASIDVAGVPVDCNEYSIELDNAQIKTIAKELLKELRNDKEIEKIVNDFSAVLEDAGKGAYDKFVAQVESAESKVDTITVERIDFKAYLNRKGEVFGRSFAVKDNGKRAFFECLTYDDNGEKNFSFKAEAENRKLLISGKGKETQGKLSGTYDLSVDSKKYAVITVDGFDKEAAKRGTFSGKFNIKPGEDLDLSKIAKDMLPKNVDPSVSVLFASLDPELDVEILADRNTQTMKAVLLESGGEVLVLNLNGASSEPEEISVPTDAVSFEDKDGLKQYFSELRIDSVVSSLERAGLPEKLVEQLKSLAAILPLLFPTGGSNGF
ncbi:MAG: hypothetical protein ILP10_06255, partial [Lachnospiraceae bacterium]|nr:hypothetical protein [Lachnospiraceae bacterium]